MRFGFVIPTGDVRTVGELAHEAGAAGWDGAFYWDGISVGDETPIYDPWVVLAVMGMRTERIRLGLMLDAAGSAPAVEAGAGSPLDRPPDEWASRLASGPGRYRRSRVHGRGRADRSGHPGRTARRESRISTGLWTGQPFSYHGKHYTISNLRFLPTPVQSPRVPIWVVGVWNRPKSMRRALRYDGIIPTFGTPENPFRHETPDELAALRQYIEEHRPETGPFDVIVEGVTPGDDPAAATAIVGPRAEAGATWWIESRWEAPNEPEDLRRRIRQGPPPLK